MNIQFQIIHGWIRNAGKAVEKEVESIDKSARDIPILESYIHKFKKDLRIRI
ncbi:hypothetical protein Cyrtocomes_00202 [Candidatus Cyrtobacter comes]|uniref:Uncharacterized protein n=1 Tax=Candidatus Cyrtobacter comes TaxID=675776 RepID=A0ABU5L7Q3_9RICK|nr:hypothetical protein [Candidatus Cyrtobacter comes]